jgi:hypothetical protein
MKEIAVWCTTNYVCYVLHMKEHQTSFLFGIVYVFDLACGGYNMPIISVSLAATVS